MAASPVIDAVIIRFRPTAVEGLLRGPHGEVVRYESAVAGRVVTVAKRRVGVNAPRPGAPGGGKLKRSIRARPRLRFKEPAIDVEAGRNPPLRYAYPHHEGGEAHTIDGNPWLHFFWEKKGEFISILSVQHPGNKANPFLVDAARIVGLRVKRARRRVT